MGRGIVSAGLHRTERLKLETRTNDPPSPADGERWLRADLSDTANDKLAELRWYDGSATNSIDVVATGSTDSGVAEILRMQTPNGTGVIPAVSPPGDAAFPSQRLRHAGVNHGLGVNVYEIPDSVIHRWRYDEGSGSTAADVEGNWDGQLNGPSWTSGNWVGGHAIDGDGVNDYIDYGSSSRSFGSMLDSDVALLVTIKTTSDSGVWLGSRQGGSMNLFWSMNRESGGPGEIEFFLRSEDDTDGEINTDARFDDGGVYRVVLNKKTNDASNWEMWVNATERPVSTGDNNFSGNVADFNQNLYSHAENDSGSDTSHYDGILDNLILANDSLSSTEIQNDYDNQPWT